MTVIHLPSLLRSMGCILLLLRSAVGEEEAGRRLALALEDSHRRYDAEAAMLWKPFSSPGYHTTLTGGRVHPTRESLKYAVALLDTGDEEFRVRAERVLERVIGLQDADPASRTYGIWPWFLEEPLAKMSPPDWNWADFCGVQLLQVARDHRSRLTPGMAAKVEGAIRHAAASIRRRDVGPGYTNIALMGTYVTLVAGELYRDEELLAYGMARLKRFDEHTRRNGGFTEYNSPTYTIVAVEEIERMRAQVRTAEARPLIEALHRRAWQEVADHFHPPTGQWAGPHSRAYSDLLGTRTLAAIERATGGRTGFFEGGPPPVIDELRPRLECPPELVERLVRLDGPREEVRVFTPGRLATVGTTWLHPDYALGSVNRGDFWNQRRPLLAYWNRGGRPAYLRVRLLKDGYDFAAARFFSAQRRGTVVAAVNFATDGGDRHVSLDRLKEASLRAKDLRLRIELGGAAGGMSPAAPLSLERPALLDCGPFQAALSVPYAEFDGRRGRWEAFSDAKAKTCGLDVVLHAGSEREFRLDRIERAALGLVLRMGGLAEGPDTAELAKGRLRVGADGLSLSIPVKPAPVRAQESAFRSPAE